MKGKQTKKKKKGKKRKEKKRRSERRTKIVPWKWDQIFCKYFSIITYPCRTQCPLNEITIALQCGGSDAFSGISGNPVSGLVAKEVIKVLTKGKRKTGKILEILGEKLY